jgi:glycosyltransferase involved in cell wall biosynthesis
MLVSCILPTRNRRAMAAMAIASYLSQDWDEKELVVADDGADAIYDLVADLPNVTYLRLPTQPTLSHKQNAAIRAARGQVICHFYDDCWSAPGRVRDQVNRLLKTPGAKVSGYNSCMFWDEVEQRASRYVHTACYSWGPLLCYGREWALHNPWPEHIAWCEDEKFVSRAREQNALVSASAAALVVIRLHAGEQRRPEAGHRPHWPSIPVSDLPEGFRRLMRLRASEPAAEILSAAKELV